jgi:hypothetical protein
MAPRDYSAVPNSIAVELGVRIDEVDSVIDIVNRPVNVVKGALLQSLREAVVLFMSDVLVGFLQ